MRDEEFKQESKLHLWSSECGGKRAAVLGLRAGQGKRAQREPQHGAFVQSSFREEEKERIKVKNN